MLLWSAADPAALLSFIAAPGLTSRFARGELRGRLIRPAEEITLWDLRAKEPRVEQRRDGRYRVTFVVDAQKRKADAIGRDRTVPMNDWIEVGVFAGAGLREPLYLQKHWIRSGRQTFTVDVSRPPTHVAIDPYAMLIERDALERVDRDNVVEVPALTQ